MCILRRIFGGTEYVHGKHLGLTSFDCSYPSCAIFSSGGIGSHPFLSFCHVPQFRPKCAPPLLVIISLIWGSWWDGRRHETDRVSCYVVLIDRLLGLSRTMLSLYLCIGTAEQRGVGGTFCLDWIRSARALHGGPPWHLAPFRKRGSEMAAGGRRDVYRHHGRLATEPPFCLLDFYTTS